MGLSRKMILCSTKKITKRKEVQKETPKPYTPRPTP